MTTNACRKNDPLLLFENFPFKTSIGLNEESAKAG